MRHEWARNVPARSVLVVGVLPGLLLLVLGGGSLPARRRWRRAHRESGESIGLQAPTSTRSARALSSACHIAARCVRMVKFLWKDLMVQLKDKIIGWTGLVLIPSLPYQPRRPPQHRRLAGTCAACEACGSCRGWRPGDRAGKRRTIKRKVDRGFAKHHAPFNRPPISIQAVANQQ